MVARHLSRSSKYDCPQSFALTMCSPEKLAAMYGTRFELRYPPKLTALNYGYPDLLDRTRRTMNWGIFHHHQVCDVDSANFAYAGGLQAFFHPSFLVGTEVDGHPLYCNEQSRNNDAHGHIQALSHTNYVVTDFCHPPRRYHPCLVSLRHSPIVPGLELALRLFIRLSYLRKSPTTLY